MPILLMMVTDIVTIWT